MLHVDQIPAEQLKDQEIIDSSEEYEDYDESRILKAREAMHKEKTYSHTEVWNLLGIPD